MDKDKILWKLIVEECCNGIVIDNYDTCEKIVVEESKKDTEHKKAKLALGNIIYNLIERYVDEFCSCQVGMRIEFYDPNTETTED